MRGVAILLAVTAATASAAAAAPPRFTNTGTLVPLSGAARHAMLRRHRSPHVYLLATVGRITVFRFGDSGRCYGATRDFDLSAVTAASVPDVFGGVSCWQRPTPLMDFSVVGASRAHPEMHIERLLGVAADEIASVQLLSAGGAVVGTVPVRHNVFALEDVPIQAVDLRGVTRAGKPLPARNRFVLTLAHASATSSVTVGVATDRLHTQLWAQRLGGQGDARGNATVSCETRTKNGSSGTDTIVLFRHLKPGGRVVLWRGSNGASCEVTVTVRAKGRIAVALRGY